jgi:hypothetical protein
LPGLRSTQIRQAFRAATSALYSPVSGKPIDLAA